MSPSIANPPAPGAKEQGLPEVDSVLGRPGLKESGSLSFPMHPPLLCG